MKTARWCRWLLYTVSLTGILASLPALSQPIAPASDGTGTVVTPHGNRFDIQGGTLSGDRTNLFHSFQQFGLSAGDVANFISNLDIRNILGRVTGGNPSIIDGLIQVTGGNPNLYLMNPAGIVFGTNATLNVPASFTATTANGIGFNQGWFNAFGENNYEALAGNPSAFAFTMSQPGAIVNAGNLAVGEGQSLTLLGGTVVSTGQVKAAGGQITVAAVPGENLVRMSLDGHLLSLEFQPVTTVGGQGVAPLPQNFSVLSLPQLLTGGGVQSATGITVNSDGTMQLTGSGTSVITEVGTAIVSGAVDVSGNSSGTVNVLGDKVGVVSANINASGTNGGGIVRIGGDYQGQGTIPNALRTFVSSDSVINAKSLLDGNGGRVIVWANEITGFSGQINVRGGANSGNGGFVEVSGKRDLIFNGAANLSAANGKVGTLFLDPTNITISNVPSSPGVDAQLNVTPQILQNDFSPVPGAITISQATLEGLPNTANVILEATNNITLGPLTGNQLTFAPLAGGGSITLTADADNSGAGNFVMNPGDTIQALGRTITISGASVNVGNVIPSLAQGNAGSLNITATNGDITVNGYLNATSVDANAGSISLRAPNGNITINTNGTFPAGILDTRSTFGNGGEIRLEAGGNITTGSLWSNIEGTAAFNAGNITVLSTAGSINTSAGDVQTFSGGGNGGAIALTAPKGTIIIGNLNSTALGGQGSTGNGGNIAIAASGNITTSNLLSTADGNAGNILIASTAGSVNTLGAGANPNDNLRSSTLTGDSGGGITINAAGNITTGNIRSFATVGTGGVVNLISINGGISIGLVDPSGNVNGGNSSGAISLNAQGDITTGALFSPFSDNSLSGGIGIISNGGLINVPQITYNGGGAINLIAPNGITVGSISPVGIQVPGDISISSNDSILLPASINTNGGNFTLISSSNLNFSTAVSTGGGNFSLNNTGAMTVSGTVTTLGGNITLFGTTIDTSTVTLNSSNSSNNGGAIALSASGNITTADVNSNSTASGNGGDITLISNTGAITTGNLNSSAAINGGNILVQANTQITTGQINSSGATGKGGNVTLDPIGDIQVSLINAQGYTTGGSVDITTGNFFRATDTFTSSNGLTAVLSTVGGTAGGNITIRHGGQGITPFDVGNATTNGTAGAITSGNFTIALNQSFPYTYTLGNIRIISVDAPPPPPSIPTINPVDFNLPPTAPTTPQTLARAASPLTIDSPITQIEQSLTDSYTSYLGISAPPATVSLEQAQASLRKIEQATGIKPALIYAVCVPTNGTFANPLNSTKSEDTQPTKHSSNSPTLWQFNSLGLTQPQPTITPTNNRNKANEQLQLILVTAEGKPIQHLVEGANCAKVLAQATTFRSTVTDQLNRKGYLAPGQQFYRWLIAPIEQDLQARNINNLTFIMEAGLRSIPLAAMHDGTGFIIERYSVGLMPSLSLSDTRYVDVRNSQVLGMGASEFTELQRLEATPLELSLITDQLWQGQSFLNEGFTLQNLTSVRSKVPYGIIHLATHAEFQAGELSNSYIQLWNSKLTLDKLRQLGLNKPPVELLVLSACRTALGNESAELGFTGLAVQAGVKSALGSLWYVSDQGTLGLMTTFYEQLKQTPIKAEALRRAQLAMLNGEVRLQGEKLVTSGGSFSLPPKLAELGDQDLTHPYYWSAFTLIGNPW